MNASTDRADRSLLVAVYGERVIAIDRHSGHLRWQAELPTRAKADLVLHAERVFVLQSQIVHCYDYGSGRLIGRVELPFRAGTDQPRLLVDGEQLIISDSCAFACFTLEGELLWQQTELRSAGGKGPFGFPGNVLAPDWLR